MRVMVGRWFGLGTRVVIWPGDWSNGWLFTMVGRVNDGSFSPHSTNLHGQPVTYLEARHIVLKMLVIASNHSKMQHNLSTSRTISLLTSCLGDPFEENVTNGMICLANLAQNDVDSHPLVWEPDCCMASVCACMCVCVYVYMYMHVCVCALMIMHIKYCSNYCSLCALFLNRIHSASASQAGREARGRGL